MSSSGIESSQNNLLASLIFGWLRSIAGRPPTRPRALAAAKSCVRSFLNQPSLELRQCGEDVEYQFAGCGCGVDHAIGDGPKTDTSFFQIFDHVDQVTHRTPQPVQSPNDKRITLAQQFIAGRQSGTILFSVTGRFKTSHSWALQNQPLFVVVGE